MNIKITKSILPANSLAKNYLPADYVDVFSTVVAENKRLTPDNMMIAFWTDFPQWVQVLFQLRDWLVKPFGLKTNENEKDFKQKFEVAIRNSGQYNLMTVPAKSADETVMRLTDKHLTAELSVCNEKLNDNQLRISIITFVHFHNALGKVYFFVIRPFHKIIVKAIAKRNVKRLFIKS
ncbi:MAG: DUF2867 domain-containing protein [Prevotellaceae bacterium]|jgi:hypothetical protein|nr:DUF2867 domain-containing protein [Prevotellaceae bacterium]